MTGDHRRPRHGEAAPSRRLSPPGGWDDSGLPAEVLADVRRLVGRMSRSGPAPEARRGRRGDASGLTCVFRGPSGPAKARTAALIGSELRRPVHQVDWSDVASRSIGETEKNLARLLTKAEEEGWILFFDEADALFGKRTGMVDAHDRYANQEVSSLLKRIEAFRGIVILATDFGGETEDASARGRRCVLEFPPPSP